MELITPSIGLIIWTVMCFACFILTIIAVIKLVINSRLDILTKLFWAFIIVFIPAIGPILFLVIRKRGKENHTLT
jgi:hypothetical protein